MASERNEGEWPADTWTQTAGLFLPWSAALTVPGSPEEEKNKTIYHVLHALWPASEHGEWVSSTTCYNTNTGRLLTQAEEKVLSNQKQTRGWATHLTATCAVNTYDYFKGTILVYCNTGLVFIVTTLSLLSVVITLYSNGKLLRSENTTM